MPKQASVDYTRWGSIRAVATRDELARLFERNGYLRSPPRRDEDPHTHRGTELRYSALDPAERDYIVRALRSVGVEPGRPFAKGPSWRVPVYGEPAALLRADLVSRGIL